MAIRPDGSLIAVGLRNGVVRLLSPWANEKRGQIIELEPVEDGKGSPMAHMLCFSRDGAKLAVGRQESDDFTVYDVTSAAIIKSLTLEL